MVVQNPAIPVNVIPETSNHLVPTPAVAQPAVTEAAESSVRVQLPESTNRRASIPGCTNPNIIISVNNKQTPVSGVCLLKKSISLKNYNDIKKIRSKNSRHNIKIYCPEEVSTTSSSIQTAPSDVSVLSFLLLISLFVLSASG